MSDTFMRGVGGAASQINMPVYASEAVGNCRGTGAQLDFSVVLRSTLPKLIPQRVIPFLYMMLLKGMAASNTHFSSLLLTVEYHLLSQLRSTLPPSYIVPSHWAPAAFAPKEKPFVWSSNGSMKKRKLSFLPNTKSLRNDST